MVKTVGVCRVSSKRREDESSITQLIYYAVLYSKVLLFKSPTWGYRQITIGVDRNLPGTAEKDWFGCFNSCERFWISTSTNEHPNTHCTGEQVRKWQLGKTKSYLRPWRELAEACGKEGRTFNSWFSILNDNPNCLLRANTYLCPKHLESIALVSGLNITHCSKDGKQGSFVPFNRLGNKGKKVLKATENSGSSSIDFSGHLNRPQENCPTAQKETAVRTALQSSSSYPQHPADSSPLEEGWN